MAHTITIDGTTHALTDMQYNILSYLRNCGTYVGMYYDDAVGWMDGSCQLRRANIDRSLASLVALGLAQPKADAPDDYEVTELGQRIIAGMEDNP